jgi:hypothetical protein
MKIFCQDLFLDKKFIDKMAIFFDIYNRMTSKKTFSSSAWNVNRPTLQGCDGRNSALSSRREYD